VADGLGELVRVETAARLRPVSGAQLQVSLPRPVRHDADDAAEVGLRIESVELAQLRLKTSRTQSDAFALPANHAASFAESAMGSVPDSVADPARHRSPLSGEDLQQTLPRHRWAGSSPSVRPPVFARIRSPELPFWNGLRLAPGAVMALTRIAQVDRPPFPPQAPTAMRPAGSGLESARGPGQFATIVGLRWVAAAVTPPEPHHCPSRPHATPTTARSHLAHGCLLSGAEKGRIQKAEGRGRPTGNDCRHRWAGSSPSVRSSFFLGFRSPDASMGTQG
jgi:hypothetical protein